MIKLAIRRRGTCSQLRLIDGGVGWRLVIAEEIAQPGKRRWVGNSGHEPSCGNRAV
jgi:hypothetical protein